MELEEPNSISAATEESADWTTCLELLLHSILSQHLLLPQPIPQLHDMMIRFLTKSSYPPHSRNLRVIYLWLETCTTASRMVGLPILPLETQDFIAKAFQNSAEMDVSTSHPRAQLSASSLEDLEAILDDGELAKQLMKVPIIKVLEPVEEGSTERKSCFWRLCLMVHSSLFWISLNYNSDRQGRSGMLIRRQLFCARMEDLPVRIALQFLSQHRDDIPAVRSMFKSTVSLVQGMYPSLLLRDRIRFLGVPPLLCQLSSSAFEAFSTSIASLPYSPRILSYELRCMSIDQLNIVSSNTIQSALSSLTSADLWDFWYELYTIHPFPLRLLLSSLRLICCSVDPESKQNTNAILINHFQFFVEEPFLLLKLPLKIFQSSFSLQILILLFQEALLASRHNYEHDAALLKNFTARFESDLFLPTQSIIICKFLLTNSNELFRKSDLQKHALLFLEWIIFALQPSQAPVISRYLIMNDSFSLPAAHFVSTSVRIMSLLMETLESILFQFSTSLLHNISLQELTSVFRAISALLQAMSSTTKNASPVMRVVLLLPATIVKVYSLFSVYHNLSDLNVVIESLLLVLENIFPVAIFRLSEQLSTVTGDDSNGHMQSLNSFAHDIFGKIKKSFTEIDALVDHLIKKPPIAASDPLLDPI